VQEMVNLMRPGAQEYKLNLFAKRMEHFRNCSVFNKNIIVLNFTEKMFYKMPLRHVLQKQVPPEKKYPKSIQTE